VFPILTLSVLLDPGCHLARCQPFLRTSTNLPRNQADKARAELAKAEGKFEQYRKDAANDAMKKIDQADRKVEEGASKAKSGISSWFGGK
jgi:hypothetical protein